jgi:uncharacterized protein with NAD-binding domain and iron-sulfur cluster
MRKPKTIIIGSGLAGLSAGLELAEQGFEVVLLEASPYLGGRTASWNKEGMDVESGLHRVLSRLSIILTPPERMMDLRDEEIFEVFKQDAPRLGIDAAQVTNYRVIRHPADFYLLSPNMNKLRPGTRTPVEGLFLAGDYVQQSFMASMEGAVITGNNAAREVIAAERSTR